MRYIICGSFTGVPRRRRGKPAAGTALLPVGRVALYDLGRPHRTGVPEVILGEGKRVGDLELLLTALARAGRAAFVSRLTAGQRRAVDRWVRDGVLPLRRPAGGEYAILAGRPVDGFARGRVAIVTAGTSDAALAEEAKALLESCGVTVDLAVDVGVAGLHRLTRAAARLERAGPRVYLAFAGREGALPTVLAGLVRAPVVGVPTSTGYGRGGRGEAALSAMLQSCAPIAVVNIDGAVPAALFALQLLAGDRRVPHRR